MKIITDERCVDYSRYGHPERPERISRTLPRLRSQKELPLTWGEPSPVEDAAILRAHSAKMLERLVAGGDFDPDTPFFPDIAAHARRSIGGALAALQSARAGEPAFSLMRPPGHHATRNTSMGFCYLNSIAIAALEALATGAKRVAVYDFDVHHGNGTEDILLDKTGAAFFSIHQWPCYPGTGKANVGKNCFNFPVAPATPREEYRKILARALEGVKQFKPDFVAISAGFDAYAHDPLAQETLLAEDYHWLGGEIRKLDAPVFSVLEGGYSADLPELILAYLKGWGGDLNDASQTSFKLGENSIHAMAHQHGSALPTMLNVHHDEETSVAAGKANIAQYGGRLIELVHPGQRLIEFALDGKNYSFDPNRIFSDAGITATLNKHSSYSVAAHGEIKRFAGEYLRAFGLDREPVIIALHNTVDGIFSVESFAPSGKLAAEAAETYVSPKRSKFDFFFVTEKRFFDFLRGRDFNVVLQDNANMTDDGSLSVYFAGKGIPYINIEAEMGHLKKQIEMLASVRDLLTHFKISA